VSDSPPESSSRTTLGSRASRAAFASVLGQGAAQGLRLVGNLILSYLLFPEAFGLMLIANTVLLGLQILSELGLQPAIIRHPRGDDPDFVNTAWTIGVVRGIALFAIGLILTIPIANFYREPMLRQILPAAVSSALIVGFISTKMAILTRHLRPGPVLVIEIAAQAAGLVVMAIHAKLAPSVWVLVIGGLVTALVKTLLSQLALPGPINRFRWEARARRDLASFGKWLFVSSVFTFVAMRSDVVMLGRLLPVDTLGVYSIGIMLSMVVRDMLQQLHRFSLMPAMAASHRAGAGVLADNFARVRGLALPAALLAILGATLLAPAFFGLLYDERYHAAAWIAQLAMLAVWFSFLADINGHALLAAGNSRAWAITNAVRAIIATAGCAIGFAIGGLPGLMIGGLFGPLAAYLVSAIQLSELGISVLRTDLPWTALGLVLGGIGAFGPRMAGADSARGLALRSLVATVVLLVPFGLWVARRLLGESWAQSDTPWRRHHQSSTKSDQGRDQ